jgi:hypothetical protein
VDAGSPTIAAAACGCGGVGAAPDAHRLTLSGTVIGSGSAYAASPVGFADGSVLFARGSGSRRSDPARSIGGEGSTGKVEPSGLFAIMSPATDGRGRLRERRPPWGVIRVLVAETGITAVGPRGCDALSCERLHGWRLGALNLLLELVRRHISDTDRVGMVSKSRIYNATFLCGLELGSRAR